MVRPSLLVVGLLIAQGASAHTKLAGSEPAAGETVAAPVEIVLTFSGEVRLTAVTLADTSGAEQTLGDVRADTAANFVIPVEEPLAPGTYVITWRAVGADTHVVSGEITFSVSAGPHAR